MTLTIDLSAEEERRLRADARRKGLGLQECARQVLSQYLPAVPARQAEDDPTLALFAEWADEDAHMTPAEAEEEERLWEEFMDDINASRQAMGMRLL